MTNKRIEDVKDYIDDRITSLESSLERIGKAIGTNCIGFAADDAARDELIWLKEFLEEE